MRHLRVLKLFRGDWHKVESVLGTKIKHGGRNVVRLFKVTANYFRGHLSLNHWITIRAEKSDF